ncbi:cytochrome c [Halomonas sp. CKK8]|uniref:c-type cytochrome n=1 Tax=Halomonas sp. CKK8 TaxID=3036127 RepID=UPI002414F485|nr:cytochrome c [Halomonas sp. CKK8]WFM70332.1 cytochrome c [Halomonas sp. CKK8]
MRRQEPPVTAVQDASRRRRRRRLPLTLLALAVVVAGVLVLAIGVPTLWRYSGESVRHYADPEAHFRHGSIGSEPESGLPVRLWRVLPELFPETLGEEGYEAFGFLFAPGDSLDAGDLPIGVGTREVRGVKLGWFNCAVCHTGTVRESPEAEPRLVSGMPANNLDLNGFIAFLLEIADDPRLAPDSVLGAMEAQGQELGWVERLVWRHAVLPRVREGLLATRARLAPLLAEQPAWGPGRVDTFNPYKLIQFDMTLADLTAGERVGTADYPSIFLQRPRQGMDLHWDGNNTSLQERNLSAALGAGVTEQSVDHAAIERVADWLLDLEPPPSPHDPDAEDVAAGKALYMRHCADCHGYQEGERYVFEGERLGEVVPNATLGADPARLDSYTETLRRYQLTLFADDERYRFRHFRKTDGYANQPLDGLWLRAPYLHNGSVPTLHDLLLPPEARPTAFVRGLDVLDGDKGGFVAPGCTPGASLDEGFCFDTRLPGNGNQGHDYGTGLAAGERTALIDYLLTF